MNENTNILVKTCVEFCHIIEKYTEYVVVSGFFVITSGRSRATEDIDIISKRIDLKTFKKMHMDLTRNNFICMQSSDPNKIFYTYLIENIPVRYFKENKLIPNVELKFTKDKLDEYQIENREKIDFTGVDVFFSSIEMNIAFKEELLKSKKDLEDAKYLRIVYKNKINEKEVERIKDLIKKYKF